MAKVAPSPNEVKLTPANTNQVFQCLGEKVSEESFVSLLLKLERQITHV